MIRIGQIGVGNWGKNLLRNFTGHPETELVAISDTSQYVMDNMARRYPQAELYPDAQKLIRESGTEAIVIATESSTHFRFAFEALEQGKHVFVEKPMALVPEEAERLAELAALRGLVLMVGHLLMYHPAYLKAKELMDAGELGDIQYMYSTRVNLGVVRHDENALWSLAPHDISIALMFMQDSPESVVCTGQNILQPGIEDVAFLTIHFPNHRMAHVHVSWLDPHKVRQLTVVGSQKMVVVDDMEANEKVRIYDKGVDKKVEFASYSDMLTLREGDILVPRIEMREPLRLECDQFVKSIQGGGPPPSDGTNGLKVVRVLAAADQSLKNGGVPVEIGQTI